MYVVMLTMVEEEGVLLVNGQLIVNIIPVDHKSYRIEAMSPNFDLWPFKNAHQHCNTCTINTCITTVICTLFCSHIPYNRAAPIPGICISIGPIPAILIQSESVKYVIQAQILCFVHY